METPTQSPSRTLGAGVVLSSIALGLLSPLGCDYQKLDQSEAAESIRSSDAHIHDQRAILEIVFRDTLPNQDGAQLLTSLGDGEILFLATIDKIENKYIDVPHELIVLFSQELSVPLKQISEAVMTPPGKRAFDEPFYRDAETGKRGRVFYVSKPRWLGPNEVELDAGMRAAPLAASGTTIVLTKSNGQWRIVKRRDSWIS